MATVDKTGGQSVAAWTDVDNIFVLRNRVDFTDIVTADVVECLKIPAGTLVLNVMTKVVTAETCGAVTSTLGDASGANSWDASVNHAATAGTITAGAGGTDAYVTAGKLYSSADTIDCTMTVASGPMVAGVMDFQAVCVRFL